MTADAVLPDPDALREAIEAAETEARLLRRVLRATLRVKEAHLHAGPRRSRPKAAGPPSPSAACPPNLPPSRPAQS